MKEKTLLITRLNVTYFLLVNINYEYISFLIFTGTYLETSSNLSPNLKCNLFFNSHKMSLSRCINLMYKLNHKRFPNRF